MSFFMLIDIILYKELCLGFSVDYCVEQTNIMLIFSQNEIRL